MLFRSHVLSHPYLLGYVVRDRYDFEFCRARQLIRQFSSTLHSTVMYCTALQWSPVDEAGLNGAWDRIIIVVLCCFYVAYCDWNVMLRPLVNMTSKPRSLSSDVTSLSPGDYTRRRHSSSETTSWRPRRVTTHEGCSSGMECITCWAEKEGGKG